MTTTTGAPARELLMQKYVIAFHSHKVLGVLGALKEMIPGAKITHLSLNYAEIECPICEEQSLHYILEDEDCTFSKSRTYHLLEAK